MPGTVDWIRNRSLSEFLSFSRLSGGQARKESSLGFGVHPFDGQPTSHNKKVAACARFTRFGERGTEAAPATSKR